MAEQDHMVRLTERAWTIYGRLGEKYGLHAKQVASNVADWVHALPACQQEMAVRMITRERLAAWVADGVVRHIGPPQTPPGASATGAEDVGA